MTAPTGPREQLEAVIREQLTRVTANALTTGTPSTGMFNRATEAILAAAGDYARSEYGITADRRAVLDAAGKVPGRDGRSA